MFSGYYMIKDYIKKYRKGYLIALMTLTVSYILSMIPPRIIGDMVNMIEEGSLTWSMLKRSLFIVFFLAAMMYLFDYLWSYYLYYSGDSVAADIRSQLMRKLTKQSPVFFEKYPTGEIMAHMTNDIDAVHSMAGYGIMCIGDGIIFPVMLIIFMSVITSWKLTLVALLPYPLLAWSAAKIGKKIYTRFDEAQAAFAQMNDQVVENVSGVRVVRAFVMENRQQEQFHLAAKNIYMKNIAVAKLNSLFMPIARIVQGVSYVLVLLYGHMLLRNGAITLGNLMAFFMYLSMLVWPMFAISDIINEQQMGSASMKRINRLLDYKEEITDSPEAVDLEKMGTIRFEEYSFRYPKSKEDNLSHIDWTIAPGATLGVVGKTGSGKGTLITQLLRYYPMQSIYTMDGHPVTDFTVKSWRDKFGLVTQEQIIFSKSIRENIRMGRPDATEEDILEALRLADLEKDLDQFQDGLDTMAGEKGVALSGGQKQRIAIARALLKDPEILILDDSLSAVDAETESQILENLRRARQGKTTIIVAHRLSAVKDADEILVMDNGRIIQRGRHEELVKEPGWYRKLAKLQSMEVDYGQEQ